MVPAPTGLPCVPLSSAIRIGCPFIVDASHSPTDSPLVELSDWTVVTKSAVGLMELSMTTPKGTSDAEALGVRPLPMGAVLGAH